MTFSEIQQIIESLGYLVKGDFSKPSINFTQTIYRMRPLKQKGVTQRIPIGKMVTVMSFPPSGVNTTEVQTNDELLRTELLLHGVPTIGDEDAGKPFTYKKDSTLYGLDTSQDDTIDAAAFMQKYGNTFSATKDKIDTEINKLLEEELKANANPSPG